MKRPGLTFLVMLWLWPLLSQAQTWADFQRNAEGYWTGTGSLFGEDAVFEMEWSPTLKGRFFQLSFKNVFVREGASYEMQATALYRILDGRLSATWFDSRGQILPIAAELIDKRLVSHWGDESTEQGRTEYTILEDGTMRVSDFVKKGEEYVSFGQAIYKKQSP